MKILLKHTVAALLAAGWSACPYSGMAQFPLGAARVPTTGQPAASAPGNDAALRAYPLEFPSPAAMPGSTMPGSAPAGFPPAGLAPGMPLPGPTNGVPFGAAEEEVLTETDLICVVGSEHILAGDMRIIYEPHIEGLLDRISSAQEKTLRQQYTREALKQYVVIKALYIEFFRENAGVAAAPAELAEARRKIETKANMLFFEKQVPDLCKTYKVADVRALEEKLRTKSMSLNQVRLQFVERVLASQAELRNVPEEVEIGREELIQYYAEHADDWKKPGRAQWRQLTARFDGFPNREAAASAINAMGNEVLFGGNFEATAKAKSQGFTADEGGLVDWTTQGALKSTQLDQAIFSIPLRRLSKVIEDDTGFHIIEVLEREDATTISFEAAQSDMRKAITKAKVGQLRDEYLKKVMERTVIWTRWPEDIPGSRSLTEVVEESPLTLADPSR